MWFYDTHLKQYKKVNQKGDIPSPRESHACAKISSDTFIFYGGEGPSFKINNKSKTIYNNFHNDLRILTITKKANYWQNSEEFTGV